MKLAIAVFAVSLSAFGAPFDERKLEASIQKKLGRPYVWGTTGLKSYDCSGFVWRAFRDAGILCKRTTARKMFYSLRAAAGADTGRTGTLVFFDRLRHVGIVKNQDEFYHASTSRGTTRDELNSYWRKRLQGYRTFRR